MVCKLYFQGDEEWDDPNESQNAVENSEQDCKTSTIKPEYDEEEDEELQRAFSRASDDYLRDGGHSVQEPDLDNQDSLDSGESRFRLEALGTGSSSWHSEDGGPVSRRGGDTPSSCATPTSASFPSEPEAEGENGSHNDLNNPAAPYPCQFCDRSFPRLSYLKKHEQSHGDQMPYKCSWCARLFKHKRSRDRHVKLHTGDRRYRCTHCEAAFSRSDHLKIHMKTHDTQKPYQCTACSRGYNTAAALTSHMQSHKKHHGHNQGSKIESDFGRRSVSSHSTASPPVPNSPSPSLNLTLNARNQSKGSPMVPSASNTPILHSPMKLACMYCTRDSFTSMQQLQMHVHAMHRAILSGENLTMPSPGQMSEVSGLSRDKIFESREKTFNENDKKHAEDREKLVEGANLCVKKEYFDNSFSCGQCTMKFSNLSTLRDHLISIHRVDGFGATLMCPLCGIPCVSAAAYAEHYVLQHCDDRRINYAEKMDYSDFKSNSRIAARKAESIANSNKCSRDEREMIVKTNRELVAEPKMNSNGSYESKEQPADLTNKHVRPAEPYSAGTLLCGQCGAALKDFESFREHLARHLQADHRKEAAKNPCPKCEASFQDREEMLVHLTKHFLGQVTKEYVCGVCKKFYPHPDLLQRHLLDSHAHHLYRCALCRDTFDSRVAIQVHFAVKHSQECRIYRCNVCPATNNENSPGNSPGGANGNLFRSEAEMASHVRAVHAPPVTAIDSPMVLRSPSSTPSTLGANLRCVFCGVCCASDLELQLHLANHSASLYRCPICREGFAVEFLLDKHMQSHHIGNMPNAQSNAAQTAHENGRSATNSRTAHNPDEAVRIQKRGRSPASSNNNSLNQRDNNNKRPNYGSNAQHCELCERGEFANDAELQAHKKLAHTPPKAQNKSLATLSLTCAYCGEVCRSRSELESHTRIQHASNEPGGRHKCNICDEVCPSGSTLAEHKLQKHCKILVSDTCVVCRGTLNSESQFLEHVQRHSLENVDPQQRVDNSLPHLPSPCVICRQTLISDLECRLHARYHLRATSSQNSSPNLSRKSPNLSCCLCLREFPAEDFVSLPSNPASGASQSQLQVCKSCYVRHTQGLPILHSPYEHVRQGAKDERTWDQTRDKWDPKSRPHKDYGEPQESKVIATEDEIPRCEDCGVKFEAVEELEAHRIQEHPQREESHPKTYTCIQCQIPFATESEIQKHVRQEHLESMGKSCESLRCHLCPTEASSPLQLQAHLIEHTFAGCAALSCYICQALFTAPAGLQNHMLQQHGLGARPYDCSLCSLKFFFRAELDHHLITSHRGRDSASPRDHQLPSTAIVVKNFGAEKEVPEQRSQKVRVKDEVVAAVEEEDVNVDEQDDEGREQDQVEDQNLGAAGEGSEGKIEGGHQTERSAEKPES
ncbi:zinc finger protein 423 homolog isoform X2 [Athalia rosae]|uniref:zinc finger protein 423 homolog isoform X2 n=1 Tax=Athalia rosae TaxID=37344 RepID=UPI00203368E3|nr:zinc finger protein 423 homolog isoform X2 [Athalia rosae]